MASILSAGTTSATALTMSADTSGVLQLASNNGVVALTIDTSQKITFAYPPTATGGGGISTNTAYGTSALAANTTGSNQSAFGYQAGFTQTTADRNTMMGTQAGYAATNGSANAYFGYQAGYGNTTGYLGVAVGAYALAASSTGYQNTAVGAYALTASTGNYNVALGKDAGLGLTTGSYNTFAGPGAGYAMTTGSKNTIIGAFGGNNGVDIRTSSNNIILSDGDGNARAMVDSSGWFSAGDTPAYLNLSVFRFNKQVTQGTQLMTVSAYPTSNEDSIRIYAVTTAGMSTAGSAMQVAKNGGTSRSINAAGTLNASGADYAEYMTKASDFVLAKGDVCGIDANGKLTNVFADAISFVVKSTDPSYVGGDTWFNEPMPKNEDLSDQKPGDPEYDDWQVRMEEARQTVDRIAFSGQVPVNVTGATVGQYIIPVEDNGSIKGEAVSNPTFEQYQQAVGKVIAIEQDGRARIIVKVA